MKSTKNKLIVAKVIAGSQSIRKKRNSEIKAKNGNGKSTLKIISWNKGNASIRNRMLYIKKKK